MSFQDVGRPRATRPPSSGGYSHAIKSGAAGVLSEDGSTSSTSAMTTVPTANASVGLRGYDQLSDSIVQYQKNVALLEKMARNVGTANDTSVLQTQCTLQIEVIRQLGTQIETLLYSLESRLSTLSRTEAAQSRSTHVKLNRDFNLVEKQFKNIQLEIKRKSNLAERRRIEEEEKNNRTAQRGGRFLNSDNGTGGYKEEEENQKEALVRRQMQIQEDKINEEIMREREEEIRNIHKGMHQVNEIYKDLAHLVDSQQEGIDQIETQMENAKENTATGLKHIEKANQSQQSQCVIT